MRRIVVASLLIIFVIAFALPSDARGRRGGDRIREQVEWIVVPEPVQVTIQEHSADGKVSTIEKETRRGNVTYEATVERADGKTIAIEVAADGKLISVQLETAAEGDAHDH